jgi:hypothetical protein
VPHVVVSVWHMSRTNNAQRAVRLNHARELLQRFDHLPDRRTNEEGFRCLSSASVSLSPAGRASETTPSRRRHQDRFYRETFASIGSAPSRFREPHRFVVERDRESGIACGFAAEKKAWLDGLHSTATRFNSNIASIVCSLKNSSKSTNSSCLPYVDRLDLWN